MIAASLAAKRPCHELLRTRNIRVLHDVPHVQQRLVSTLLQKNARPVRRRRPGPPPEHGRDRSATPAAQPRSAPDASSPLHTPVQAENAATDEEPAIKWYQQLFPWSKERKLSDPESPDPTDDTGMVKKLKQEIDRLDAELRHMEERPFEPYMKRLSPEDREVVEKGVQKQELEELKKKQELEQYLPKLEIKWTLPLEQRSYLKELNDNIKDSLLKFENYSVRRKLWRSYIRCKSFLPPFSQLVPDEAWMALYRAQAEASRRDDAHWATRLITLVEDMRAAGRKLGPDELAMYIEALRFEDLLEDAVREWEGLRGYLGNDARNLAEYELLGVRLFTSQGDLATAERIASKYLNTGDRSESRILIPIMDTWIERGDTIGMKHAWALYLMIKMQLASSITMDDYDLISAKFLNAGRTDLALAVFKDMMLTGFDSKHDSVALYRRHISNMDRLTSATNKIPEINELYLTSLTVVPESFENKYFYAKWMKKLIGESGGDAAAAVLELMYERNVQPDAMHVNGILGSWFRSFSDTEKVRAEQVAWSMILKRLLFVKGRSPETSGPIREFLNRMQSEGFDGVTETRKHRCIPSANVETYALLLQFYARRSRFSDIQTLHKAFELGQIQPNAYWTNHLLWMLLHQNKLDDVWKLFLARFNKISRPDLDTFDCLWQSEERHLRQSKLQSSGDQDFPSPRNLLRHMLLVRYREKLSPDLYEEIIRCFMRSQDLAGTVVALQILRERFRVYPRSKTIRAVIELVAKQIPRPIETSRNKITVSRSRRIHGSKAQSSTMEIFTLVQQRRTQRLVAAGFDDLEGLQHNVQQKERLSVLIDFLKQIMQQNMLGQEVEVEIKKAASEMGLDDLRITDYLLSEYRV